MGGQSSYDRATLHGKLKKPDPEIFNEEFHKLLKARQDELLKALQGKTGEHFGADVLKGELKDVLRHIKDSKLAKFIDKRLFEPVPPNNKELGKNLTPPPEESRVYKEGIKP